MIHMFKIIKHVFCAPTYTVPLVFLCHNDIGHTELSSTNVQIDKMCTIFLVGEKLQIIKQVTKEL